MSLEETLEYFGLNIEEIDHLVNHNSFHHKKTTPKKLNDLFIKISRTYNCSVGDIVSAVLKFPPFAGLDHERVVAQAVAVYGNENGVKSAVLKHPPFAGLDHDRVVREATAVYGDENKVKSAVLKFPQFAGYDHERVVRQKLHVGSLINPKKGQILEIILNQPVLASYSAKRDIAVIDICRHLFNEGYTQQNEMLQLYIKHFMNSPYLKGTRIRISKTKTKEEPKLMTILRKELNKLL